LDDLRAKLARSAAAIAKASESPFTTPDGVAYCTGATPGKVAFLFPGQGSQYLHMGADAAMRFDAARSAWDDAAAVRFDGDRLHDVVFARPAFDDATRQRQAARLQDTRLAQPALGVASLALLRVLEQVGL